MAGKIPKAHSSMTTPDAFAHMAVSKTSFVLVPQRAQSSTGDVAKGSDGSARVLFAPTRFHRQEHWWHTISIPAPAAAHVQMHRTLQTLLNIKVCVRGAGAVRERGAQHLCAQQCRPQRAKRTAVHHATAQLPVQRCERGPPGPPPCCALVCHRKKPTSLKYI